MKKQLRIVFFVLFCIAPNTLGRATQSGSGFSLRVDVDLVTVEVIALDKSGKPVRNLSKEDFQIYENGKKQEIISFDEVKAESGSTSLETLPIIEDDRHRGKTVLIIFADSLIFPENIRKARDSASRFVRKHMYSQDLFAVASFGASMRVLQNFTGDLNKVLAAIEQPGISNSAGLIYTEEMMAALERINNSIARLKGQKSVLIYSQSVSSSPNTSGSTSLSQPRSGLFATSGGGGSVRKTLDSAKKSNVVYYLVDAGGMSGIQAGAWGGMYLEYLTQAGGYSISNTNNPDAELDKLDQQISNYYILGFQSNNSKHDGAFRKLEIKTELKRTTLRYRPGYQDRSPVDVLASSKQEKILLNELASPNSTTRLPIIFRAFYFYDSPAAARVLISARIRTGGIALKRKGGQLGTDLNIMGVAYAEDGSIAARFSEALPVSIGGGKEAEFRNGSLAYRNYFKLRPGKYRLKFAVSDESENLGSIEQLLQVPALPTAGLGFSSLVLAEKTSQLPDLIQNLQTQMLDESDPLVYSGLEIEPRVENRLNPNSTSAVFFRIYNLPGNLSQLDLVAKPKLLNGNGSVLDLDSIPLKRYMSPAGNSTFGVAFTLPFKKVTAGKYRLLLEIINAGTVNNVNPQTDLEFVP
jgi:VWFA-related protein